MRRLVLLCATAGLLSCYQRPNLSLTRPSNLPSATVPTAAVHGLVTDVSGGPLTGALVEWSVWGEAVGVLTDTEGAYTIRRSGPGSQEGNPLYLRATLAGYAEKVVETRLADGLEVNFKLSPAR